MSLSPSPIGPLRVGLLGYGLGGRVFHAPLIEAAPGLELAVVVTSDPDRAAEVTAHYPRVTVLPSAEEMFARAQSLDLALAVVATPNDSHAPLTHRALAAGLAVVVDKPMAPTSAQARALITDAERRGRPLTVFQNRRLDADLLTVRRLIQEGALGTVVRFESRWDRWRPTAKTTWRERGGADEGGGLLLDLGSHLVDQAVHLFGDVVEVYGEVAALRPGVEADDDFFIALHHASGVRSHVGATNLAGLAAPRFRVLGDRAAYLKYGLDVQEERLRQGADLTDPSWSREPESAWGVLGSSEGEQRVATEPGGFLQFYSGVARALLTGGPMPVDPWDAVRVLEILERARAAAGHRDN
jgi:scyllo-inositol 2-dehydrogenase (NADP+)